MILQHIFQSTMDKHPVFDHPLATFKSQAVFNRVQIKRLHVWQALLAGEHAEQSRVLQEVMVLLLL